MKGDFKLSVPAKLILIVLIVLILISLITSTVSGSFNPIQLLIGPTGLTEPSGEEIPGFYDLCFYWSTINWEGRVVCNAQNKCWNMDGPCRRELGKPEDYPLTEDDWENCKERCPGYE